MLCRVAALAELDARTTSLDVARAHAREGDTDHAWLLAEWEAGRVLLACMEVTASAEDADGTVVRARRVIDGVWLEGDDPPAVERQVAETAPAELAALAAELGERGARLAPGQLEGAFLHVELGPRLHDALVGRSMG